MSNFVMPCVCQGFVCSQFVVSSVCLSRVCYIVPSFIRNKTAIMTLSTNYHGIVCKLKELFDKNSEWQRSYAPLRKTFFSSFVSCHVTSCITIRKRNWKEIQRKWIQRKFEKKTFFPRLDWVFSNLDWFGFKLLLKLFLCNFKRIGKKVFSI